MEPYPLVDRKRIIKRYQAGDSTEEIAEDLGYCVAGVRRIRQRYEETGSLLPRSTKPGRKPAFDAQTLDRLAAEVARRSDITLRELRSVIGIQVGLSVYCNALKQLGLSRKKRASAPVNRTVRM